MGHFRHLPKTGRASNLLENIGILEISPWTSRRVSVPVYPRSVPQTPYTRTRDGPVRCTYGTGFRSATDRAAFSNELTDAITKLVSKYHDESAPGGRAHRLVVVAHPLPQKSDSKEPS